MSDLLRMEHIKVQKMTTLRPYQKDMIRKITEQRVFIQMYPSKTVKCKQLEKQMNNNLLEVNAHNGMMSIVVSKITGVTTLPGGSAFAGSKSFIATGPCGEDGEENGFFSTDDYDTVTIKLQALLGDQNA